MAKIEPMTLDDLQTEIHALYQNGIDVPAVGEEDYILRTTFINNVIGTWQDTPGIRWRELYDIDTSLTYAYAAGLVTLPTPVSYRELAGQVKLTRASDGAVFKVDFYEPEQLDNADLETVYGWVSGSPGSYKLNFFGVPAEWDGSMISYRFYHYATQLAVPGDIPDMSNPRYIVSMVASRLHQLGRNNSGYTVNFDDAQELLKGMITKNSGKSLIEKSQPMGGRIIAQGVMGE